jgi:hypothetical protein
MVTDKKVKKEKLAEKKAKKEMKEAKMLEKEAKKKEKKADKKTGKKVKATIGDDEETKNFEVFGNRDRAETLS